MNRILLWTLGVCLAAMMASTTGCMSDCERVDSWQHEDSAVCRDCVRYNCRALQDDFVRLTFSSCLSQYSAASRCPDNRDHCACIDREIQSQTCRAGWYDLLSCQARNCDSQCR